MKIVDIGNVVGRDLDVAEFLGYRFDNKLAVDGVIEILRAPSQTGWEPPSIQVDLARSDEYPLDPHVIRILTPYKEKLTGLGWEVKYRVAALNQVSDEDTVLKIVFVPTSYEESTGFHHSLIEASTLGNSLTLVRKEQLASQLITPGKYIVPGVAVVHSVIVTSDNYLILCQRSPYTGYNPLHWSISFEEQINQKDLAFGDAALVAATNRGFQEEFGYNTQALVTNNIHTLGVFLEYAILNIGFCVIMETPLSFDELQFYWKKKAKDKWEAIKISGEPFTLENVIKLLQLDDYGEVGEKRSRFHRTSKYRLLLVAIRQFGLEMIANAFKTL